MLIWIYMYPIWPFPERRKAPSKDQGLKRSTEPRIEGFCCLCSESCITVGLFQNSSWRVTVCLSVTVTYSTCYVTTISRKQTCKCLLLHFPGFFFLLRCLSWDSIPIYIFPWILDSWHLQGSQEVVAVLLYSIKSARFQIRSLINIVTCHKRGWKKIDLVKMNHPSQDGASEITLAIESDINFTHAFLSLSMVSTFVFGICS